MLLSTPSNGSATTFESCLERNSAETCRRARHSVSETESLPDFILQTRQDRPYAAALPGKLAAMYDSCMY